MADATELASLSEVKSYLKISDTTFDTILGLIKAGVEQFVKDYCHDPFLISARTEYYDGPGSSKLVVAHYPITTITSIHIDSDRVFAAASQVAAANIVDDDANDARGIIELFEETFDKGQKNVKVVYSAGNSTIPGDLKLAVLELCAREFLLQDKQLTGLTAQSVADKSMTPNLEDIPRNVWLILQAYRRPLMGV